MNTALAMEWLETDGLGGFCSSTVGLVATRGYHALLIAAKSPPVHRYALVNSIDAWVEMGEPAREVRLLRHCYSAPESFSGVLHPKDAASIESFASDPWPKWVLRIDETTLIEQEVFVLSGRPITVLSFRRRSLSKLGSIKLHVRPLMSCRDLHAMHHENDAFDFDADESNPGTQIFRPYGEATPGVSIGSNAEYAHDPVWYRNVLYREDQVRGQHCIEDLASPGTYTFDLSKGDAVLVLSAITEDNSAPTENVKTYVDLARATEIRRRKAFRWPLERAADQYIVKRGEGSSIIAGYPWFTDWGRDTFISIRGLCLAPGHLHQAEMILSAWAGSVDRGMIPNRFNDHGEMAEFNTIDASLWFVIAAGEFLELAAAKRYVAKSADKIQTAMIAIVEGYKEGTRFNIGLDSRDGLIRGGAPGFALTWMDARIGTWCVTPRIGKPIEIQALWIHALEQVAKLAPQWRELQQQARVSIEKKYFNEERRCLLDVIDVHFEEGRVDSLFRPNQVFALGGLGKSLFSKERTQAVLEEIEKKLVTPMGLRTLAPGEQGYSPRYQGNREARDAAYHQGTVWPWLMGPFVEGWVRLRGSTAAAKEEARKKFLDPLLRAARTPGSGGISIGHIAEIADGDAPHIGRGCPFQAWSVAEAMRLDLFVLKS